MIYAKIKLTLLSLILGVTSLIAQDNNEGKLDNSGLSAITPEQTLYKQGGINVISTGIIGETSQLTVRGLNTFNLNASPYIRIDGVLMRYSSLLSPFTSIYELSPLSFLNPSDIASVEVLNKASDLSLFGGKGSNGIIDIKTVRGNLNGTRLDLFTRFGIQSFDRDIDRMTGTNYKNYLNEFMLAEGMSESEINNNPIFGSGPEYNDNTDWLGRVSRGNSVFQDYYARLTGGDVDSRYMFSVGYSNKEGELISDKMDRFTMKFNLDYFLSPKLTITNSLSYGNSVVSYSELGYNYDINPLYQAATKAPFLSPYYFDAEGNKSSISTGIDELGKGNPDALVNDLYNKAEQNRVNALIKGVYKLSPDLNISTSFVVDYVSLVERQHRPANGIVKDAYRIRQNQKRTISELLFNGLASFDYSKEFTGMISGFNSSIGVDIQNFDHKSNFLRKDISKAIDEIETLGKGVTDSIGGYDFENSQLSLFGKASLKVLKRGQLGASVNYEGNSNFGDEGKWIFYPSAFANYDLISEKNFHANLDFDLGWVGNSDVREAFYKDLYYADNYYGYGGIYFGNEGFQDFKPERTTILDFGTELTFFKRLDIGVTYYAKSSTGLLLARAIPKEFGLNDQFENSGEIKNNGLEFTLAADLILKDNFKLNVWGNLSTLNNQIVNMPTGSITSYLGGVRIVAMEDEEIGSFYGYKISGIFQNESDVNLVKSDGTAYKVGDYIIEDVVADGIINEKDYQVLGSPVPDLFGSFGLIMAWKQWSLTSDFAYSYGAQAYNKFESMMNSMSDYSNQSNKVSNRWQSSTGVTSPIMASSAYGDPSNNNATSSRWVEDVDYIKMKNVMLKYRFEGSGNKAFSGTEVFVSVDNLFTLTNYSGADPEVVSSQNALTRGIDFGGNISPQTFVIGAKFAF